MQPVLYLDPTSTFPESNEKPGYFVGFAENAGDALTFLILTANMKTILTRSVVRPADDITKRNRRVTFKDDVQEDMEKIDLLTYTFKHTKNSNPTEFINIDDDSNSEDDNDDEAEEQDLGVASRTRSKIRGTLHVNTVKKINDKHPNSVLATMLQIPTNMFFILFQLALWIPNATSSILPDISESSQFRGA